LTETAGPPEEPAASATEATSVEETPPGQYWLRVHGYPVEIGEELIQYPDFFDPRLGPLSENPGEILQLGDVIIYYADGPASVYGVGRVAGPVEGPLGDGYSAQWRVAVKPQSVILAMNKAAHAVGLRPPSGWHFLRAAREHTFIRLPDGDGPYLVEQVKSRASTKGD
jgi:hypothetical protein